MGYGHKTTKGAYINTTNDLRLHWLPRSTDPFGWANGTVQLELFFDGKWVEEIFNYQGDTEFYSLSGFELDDSKPRDLVSMEYSILQEALDDGKWIHGDPRLLDDAVRVFGPSQSIKLPGAVIPVIMDDQGMASYYGSSDAAVQSEIKARLKIGQVDDPETVCGIEFSE